MMRKFALPLLCLLLGVGACSKAEELLGPTPIEDETFAPDLGVNLSKMTRTESGLYIQDLAVGEGEVAESGRYLKVHYTGRLVDGYTFDTSVGRQPYGFPLGVGRVIAGWDEGLKGMRAGGSRKLVIPSDLAYGKKGAGDIPPNATLVFDVVLVSVQCYGDSGLEVCSDPGAP
jgi:FKBP-type peptidyl-prolyl cis-trans isomerase